MVAIIRQQTAKRPNPRPSNEVVHGHIVFAVLPDDRKVPLAIFCGESSQDEAWELCSEIHDGQQFVCDRNGRIVLSRSGDGQVSHIIQTAYFATTPVSNYIDGEMPF